MGATARKTLADFPMVLVALMILASLQATVLVRAAPPQQRQQQQPAPQQPHRLQQPPQQRPRPHAKMTDVLKNGTGWVVASTRKAQTGRKQTPTSTSLFL